MEYLSQSFIRSKITDGSHMNYREARGYLENAGKYGSVLGLENMREMLGRLGNPQDDLKFIHIAGTNGKGSVLAFLSTVLKEAGYRVGRYISPTLFTYRERIQVNEACIEKEALARLVTRIAGVIDGMQQEGKTHPTVFEIETVLGFLYFQEKGCDLVVLETGLGGLLDATNVVTTTVMEVLVSIGKDHMGFLGDSLEEIAENKAGIIKPGTAVVTCEQRPEVQGVIKKACLERGCSLRVAKYSQAGHIKYGFESQHFSYGGYENLKISLAGAYQISNAVLAVEAVLGLLSLGYRIPEEALRAGLSKASWKGRFTVVNKEPLFIIDGAHNRDGAKALEESLRLYFGNRKLHYIMGVFRDKEYREMIRITAPLAEDIIAVETPENERALPAEELARNIEHINPQVRPEKDILKAVRETIEAVGNDDVILAFGSLSFLGEITKALDTVRR